MSRRTTAACLDGALEDGNTGGACRAATHLGTLHAKRGDPEAGIKWQRRAVEIAREGDDRRDVALSLHFLGDALREAGRHDEALEAYREAIETGMHPTRCEEWSPAGVWYEIAKVHKTREAWSEAIEAEAACLEGHLEDGNTGSACRAASRLGSLHAKRGEQEAGVEWQNRAVEIAREGDDRRHIVPSLQWLGDALREAGRHDEAITAYREAIATRPNRDDEPSHYLTHWLSWLSLAGIYRGRGAMDSARNASAFAAVSHARSEVASARARSESWLQPSLERLGEALCNAGQYHDSLAAYREAISLGHTATPSLNKAPLGSLWSSIAKVYAIAGDWSMARKAEQSCLDEHLAANDFGGSCRCALRLARLDALTGDAPSAVAWRGRAFDFARQGVNRRATALRLRMIGDALSTDGQSEWALTAYRESIDTGMTPTRLDKWTPAPIWRAIAEIHVAQTAWRDAIDAFDTAIDEHNHNADLLAADVGGFVRTSSLVAIAHLSLGCPSQAIEVLLRCEPQIASLATASWNSAVDTAAAWWERLAEVRLALGDEAGSRDAAAEGERLRARLADMSG